jgi:tetratricopeptide (TPR) repeat protein
MTPLLFALLPLLAAQAPVMTVGQVARSEAVVLARVEFRKGNYREALAKLEEASRRSELSEVNDRFEASLLMGLSHIYLGEAAEATEHLRDLLLIDPDFDLDPLKYGDDAKRALDAVRATPELQAALDARRGEIRQARAQADELKRLAEEAERHRRELAAIPERVPTIERHNALLNLLPFGVPQIEEERVIPGVLFAVAQGVALTATVLTYTQVQSYVESDGKISAGNFTKAKNWRIANWAAVGVAAGVYVGGVIDGFAAFRERTLRTIPREEYLKMRPEIDGSDSGKPRASGPTATPFLSPVPGGAALGIAGSF